LVKKGARPTKGKKRNGAKKSAVREKNIRIDTRKKALLWQAVPFACKYAEDSGREQQKVLQPGGDPGGRTFPALGK